MTIEIRSIDTSTPLDIALDDWEAANTYGAMHHDPGNPRVAASYDAFIAQTLKQFHEIEYEIDLQTLAREIDERTKQSGTTSGESREGRS